MVCPTRSGGGARRWRRTSFPSTAVLPALVALLVVAVAVTGGGAAPASEPPLIDAAKFRSDLLSVVAQWDGGAVSKSAPATTPFHVNLNRDWSRAYPKDTSVIAQARGVYINAEAAAVAGRSRDARRDTYVAAVRSGVATLLDRYRDTRDGGFYYRVADDGRVTDGTKDGYGNAHVLFALATGVRVLRGAERSRAVAGARGVAAYIRASLIDGMGGVKTRAGDGESATRSIDPLTHYFEALLAWWDVLPAGAERNAVAVEATRTGTFIVDKTVVAEAGDATSAYVAYNYQSNWTPTTAAYSRGTQWTTAATATPPHGMELAFLLSRAEQLGLAPAASTWVDVGVRLIRYAERHAFDNRGYLRWEVTAYDGSPLGGNPDNGVYVWWAESEAARCFLHFAVTRGRRSAYAGRTRTSLAALAGPFTDDTYGGWYRQLRVDNLASDGNPKWDRWKVAYHFTTLHVEALRLAGQ